MNILGIETSCDETSAAVIRGDVVRSNIIASQLVHQRYGGVVPELASRAHQKLIIPVVEEALAVAGLERKDLDGVAATYGPGLMGALLIGLNFGKALAFGLGIPFVGVNHMHGHLYSNFVEEPRPDYPFLCLIVSGGHTQLVLVRGEFDHELLGETRDDAAGEAYDKVGKMLGLGFPGGPAVDRLARKGNPAYVKFPRSYLDDGSLDFSFSGIKTAVLYWLRKHPITDEDQLADLCASFQAAVVDVLVTKTIYAVRKMGLRDVAVAGGVSANSLLRERMQQGASDAGARLFIPKTELCTDNGAMIALVGAMSLRRGFASGLDLTAVANCAI